MKQLTHDDIQNQQRHFPITIVCDALRTPENIGMCFRVAEGFGVEKIYLHETSPSLQNRIVKKTARNTVQQIAYDSYSNFDQLLKALKAEGNTIVGIEITDQSIPVREFKFDAHQKLTFVLGSERHGINNTKQVDHTVHIPMYGRNSSMNVVHSLSVVLYEATNQMINIQEV